MHKEVWMLVALFLSFVLFSSLMVFLFGYQALG